MRKILALLLALAMAFALCGCADSLQQIEIPPLPEVTPTPGPVVISTDTPAPSGDPVPTAPGEEAQAPATAAPQPLERLQPILVSIGRTQLVDYDQAEGTELILDFSYDMPRVFSEEFPEAASKINETLATIEETFYTGHNYGLDLQFLGYNTMLEAAEDNYAYVKEYQVEGMPLEFSDALSAKVLRVDQNVLSVRYSESIYQGGAHGSYWSFAYNFDMRSGEILSLESLSPDYDALADALVQEMLALAEEDQDEYYSQRIVEGFLPEGGREEAFRTLLREGTWALDREGLEIISSLYELGPYAAGTVSFLIPYEKLQERLDQRWMMPEDRNGKGRVLVQELSELEGGEIEIIDKVKVSEGGVNLGLVVEGQIFDVRISTVYYVDRFYENAQLWAASSLADCAVQLEVTVPEGLPDLLISYYTADGERCGKLLSQSGADGSYMLVDDNIEAVG